MKSLIISVLLASQSAFALSGVIESKFVGEKTVTVDFTAVKSSPVQMSTEVLLDMDTMDKSCQNSLEFKNVLKGSYSVAGVEIQEGMDVSHIVSMNYIQNDNECSKAETMAQALIPVYLAKGGFIQITLSQKHVNSQLVETRLFVNLPRTVGMAEVAKLNSDSYVLTNFQFDSEITANFSVVEVSGSSWSYLEHGTVVLK